MTCSCAMPRHGLWPMGIPVGCRNADLHPRMRDLYLRFDLRTAEAVASFVDELASQLAWWLPASKCYGAPAVPPHDEPAAIAGARIVADAERELAEIKAAHPDAPDDARPIEELRAAIEIDFELGRETWRYPKSPAPKRWPEDAGPWTRDAPSRDIVRAIQNHIAGAEWQRERRVRRVREDSTTLRVVAENSMGFAPGGVINVGSDPGPGAFAIVTSVKPQLIELDAYFSDSAFVAAVQRQQAATADPIRSMFAGSIAPTGRQRAQRRKKKRGWR